MRKTALMLTALAAAVLPVDSVTVPKSKPVYKSNSLPPKEWKKRKRRLKMTKRSRKQNR